MFLGRIKVSLAAASLIAASCAMLLFPSTAWATTNPDAWIQTTGGVTASYWAYFTWNDSADYTCGGAYSLGIGSYITNNYNSLTFHNVGYYSYNRSSSYPGRGTIYVQDSDTGNWWDTTALPGFNDPITSSTDYVYPNFTAQSSPGHEPYVYFYSFAGQNTATYCSNRNVVVYYP